MDRRQFVAGLFGVAGAATLAGLASPVEALAGVPVGNPVAGKGILDELQDLDTGLDEGDLQIGPEPVRHRRRHRRRRRRTWRRVCRRVFHRGRRRRRCFRERVFIWIY